MPVIDLRSDTLTMPSAEMRRAISNAKVGDDVLGEDPTVNLLQEKAADRLGKEAGLFVSSGTMGNLIGLLVSARPGQQVIADADSHVVLSEYDGAATLGGIQLVPVATLAGVMSPDQISNAITSEDRPNTRTAAVTFEDTHNRHGGTAWPLPAMRAASDRARSIGLSVHLDGARLFNGALAVGADAKDLAACADTVTFCLSKGLGAPAGSVLVGPKEAIDEARRWRKMLGGGMRQVGFLAAAGIHALDHMVDRLGEDHANARTMADGLSEIKGIRLDLARVQTNIVIFDLATMPAPTFIDECSKRGLRVGTSARSRIRLVTHYGISHEHIQLALAQISDVLAAA